MWTGWPVTLSQGCVDWVGLLTIDQGSMVIAIVVRSCRHGPNRFGDQSGGYYMLYTLSERREDDCCV